MFLFFNEKMETRQKMETQQKMTCFYFFVKKWKRTRKMEKWRRGPKNGTLEALGNRMAEVRFHRWLFVWVLIYRSLFVRSLSNSHKQCAQCQCFPVWIIDDSTPWPPLPTPRSLSSTNHADHWSTTKHIYIYILCQPKSRISYRFIMDQRDWLQQMRAYVLLFGLQ